MLDGVGLITALAATILVALLYQFVIKFWSYFSARGVKFVRGLPVLGTNYRVLIHGEPFFNAIQRLYNTYPDEPIVGMYDVGGIPQYVLRDPQLIKTIAVKQFDHFMNHRMDIDAAVDPLASRNLFFTKNQHWRDMRTTLSPAFTTSKMRGMFALVTKCGAQFVKHLRSDAAFAGDTSVVYEVKDTFSRYTNDTIASCAFGLEVNSMAEKDNDFYRTGASLVEPTTRFLLKLLGYSTIPRILTFFKVRLAKKADEKYFRDIVGQTIQYRLSKKVVRNDMIDLLLQARDGVLDGDTVGKLPDLSDTDFVAQCMIFFIAGFETVSSLLSFMSHELAQNQAIQDRLYAEIESVHRSLDGKPVTYDHLIKMVYMDMVISESLRKWPPIGTLDRVTNLPTTLDIHGKPLHIDVGDGFIIPAFGLHRDPKYWSNPETFDPERFSHENVKHIVPGTYLPFGTGPRICIGQRFALMETKSMFYHLLLEFRVEPCARTQNPLRLGKGFGASSEKGFWLQLTRR